MGAPSLRKIPDQTTKFPIQVDERTFTQCGGGAANRDYNLDRQAIVKEWYWASLSDMIGIDTHRS